MKIEETTNKTVRGPWSFELDVDRPVGLRGEMTAPYYTGSISIFLDKGTGVLISPEEAETIADILRDFAGRARQRRGGIVLKESDS